ncbi:sulfotransferase [Methyloligella sp. 2.7D]|uniref:sulfotransferase family protein n=1 Tax=unclassified Methyloligella TaxID=2625955 RepID=UPI00157C0B83|nr:sulfotransferase [Methyloligella sp. GL2]QKP77864.1 sulfotransferase [Methyloligella sp. GL2]
MSDYEKIPDDPQKAATKLAKRKPKAKFLGIHRYGGKLLYMWYGMRFGTLMKLFARGRFDFTSNCIPDVLTLILWCPINTPLYLLSELIYRRRIKQVKLDQPPVFVIGHWRTGTTFLHDLLASDPNTAYPTTYECFFPHHFLITERILSRIMKVLLPKKRPQDDVPVGFDRPQEEEFGVIMLGEGSPLITMAWPRHGPADTEYLDFEGVPAEKRERWFDHYMWFYRRLMVKHNKPLIMKSPANSARVRYLVERFPEARFIYITRNPLHVFPSTVKLWRALYSTQGLHNPPYVSGWLDDYVLDMMQRLTERFEADKHLIPEEKLVEIRYEDLVKDPIGRLRETYEKLDIGDFSAAEPKMQAYLDSRSEHKTSEYELPADIKARIVERMKPLMDRYGYSAEEASKDKAQDAPAQAASE